MIENLKIIQNLSIHSCYDFINNSKNNIGAVKQVSVLFLSKDYLKGLYYTAKTVVLNCICGEFFLAVLDLRKNSKTFKFIETLYLNSNFSNTIHIPGGCAYGFIAIKPSVLLLGRTDYSNFEFSICPISKELSIPWPCLNPVVDTCDITSPYIDQFFIKTTEYLVFGASGFIGSNIVKMLKKKNKSFVAAVSRIENYTDVYNEISSIKPKYVICAAGIASNTETSKIPDGAVKLEILKINMTGHLNVIQACEENKIHCTIFSCGSVYLNTEKILTEEDPPDGINRDFFYSQKILLENISKNFNVLVLRIQAPIMLNMNPKNLIYQLLSKRSVSDYQCSYTSVDDLFPTIPTLCEKNITGILNFVSPGTMSQNDILSLYRNIVNNTHTWEIKNEEQTSVKLCTKKLESLVEVPTLLFSVQYIFGGIIKL